MQPGAEQAHLREQAAKCRRLAESLLDPQARATLRQMAEDFETKANELAAPPVDGVPHPRLTRSSDESDEEPESS